LQENSSGQAGFSKEPLLHFCTSDALPVAQPAPSKYGRKIKQDKGTITAMFFTYAIYGVKDSIHGVA